jgi:hypothetical protein
MLIHIEMTSSAANAQPMHGRLDEQAYTIAIGHCELFLTL